jgi:hypothetical protein
MVHTRSVLLRYVEPIVLEEGCYRRVDVTRHRDKGVPLLDDAEVKGRSEFS